MARGNPIVHARRGSGRRTAHDPGGPSLAASPRRGGLQAQQRRHPRPSCTLALLDPANPRRTGRATTGDPTGRAAMGAVETPFPAGKPDVSRLHGVNSTEVRCLRDGDAGPGAGGGDVRRAEGRDGGAGRSRETASRAPRQPLRPSTVLYAAPDTSGRRRAQAAWCGSRASCATSPRDSGLSAAPVAATSESSARGVPAWNAGPHEQRHGHRLARVGVGP